MEARLATRISDLEAMTRVSKLRFSFPLKDREPLRSGFSDIQYYDIALELVEAGGARQEDHSPRLRLFLGTCPCFAGKLSEHARGHRPGETAVGTPHSPTRRVARIFRLKVNCEKPCLWFEEPDRPRTPWMFRQRRK